MSSSVSKFITKLIALVVIVAFIASFRETILTDQQVSTAFGALLGTLPFAKVIVDAICKIMKYQYKGLVISVSGTISDFLRLAVMACIQPWVNRALAAIFLRVPEGSLDAREKYMKGFEYRMKEMVLKILTAPLLAVFAAYLTSMISNYFTQNYGTIASAILGIATVLGISALSIIPLCVGGLTLGTAITWRFGVTLLSKMLTTFITNALCLWIYTCFINGVSEQIMISVVTLIVWLIIADFLVQQLRILIVS